MPKVDVFKHTRPPRRVWTEEIVLGDEAITLALRRLSCVQALSVEDRAREAYARYVTGTGQLDEFGNVQPDKPGFVPPESIQVGGDYIEPTLGTWRILAAIEMGQAFVNPSDYYTIKELAALTIHDEVATEFVRIWQLLYSEDYEANPTRGNGQPSSGPVPTSMVSTQR